MKCLKWHYNSFIATETQQQQQSPKKCVYKTFYFGVFVYFVMLLVVLYVEKLHFARQKKTRRLK